MDVDRGEYVALRARLSRAGQAWWRREGEGEKEEGEGISVSVNGTPLPADKQRAANWLMLTLRALPDCADIEEAAVVADMALEQMPGDVVLSVEDAAGNLHSEASGRFVAKYSAHVSAIPHGELHHVGGIPVRRTSEKSFRIDTDDGHVSGNAEKIVKHIEADHTARKLHGKKRDSALERAGDAEQADPFKDAELAQVEAEGFAALPKGAKVVSLDQSTHGRVGVIEKDETGRNRVKLEGTPGYASEHVEPLDEKHSWRVKTKASKVTVSHGSLFDEDEHVPRREAAKIVRQVIDAQKKKEEPISDDEIAAFFQPVRQQSRLFSREGESDKGHWITIGTHAGADGKKHGGTPVYIVDGRITKGSPSLTGKKISALGKEGPRQPSRENEDWGIIKKSGNEMKEVPRLAYRTEKAHRSYKGKTAFGDGLYVGLDAKQVADLTIDPMREVDEEPDFDSVKEVELPSGLKVFELDGDKLPGGSRPLVGERLKKAVMSAGYDAVRVKTDDLNLGGDQIVIYRQPSERGDANADDKSTHRQQMNREKNYRRASWAKKARKEGIDKGSLNQLAAEMKAHHDEYANDVKSLLQDARDSAARMRVPIHHKQLSETGDHTGIPGFDLLARSMAGLYPQILGAHGYEHSEGSDAGAEEASEKLLMLLRSGNPDQMSEDDAFEQAFNFLVEHKPKEESVPFSIDAKLSFDIFNRRAQGILNRAVAACRSLSASARVDLSKALKTDDPAEVSAALDSFIRRYRVQLSDLLTTTQLAALLEGAREVAKAIPTVPAFPGAVPPPPTLEPKAAVALLDKFKLLSGMEREEAIYHLPADQQHFIRQGLLAQQQGGAEPPGPFAPTSPAGESPDKIHYPIIDEAARELSSKNVMTRYQFDALDSAARQKSFTVAYVESLDTLAKIRDAISETIEGGVDLATFREKVLLAVDEGTFMSDAHMETVFRTNVQTAFSDGQMTVLSHPFVRSGFPYASYEAIHDDRVEHEHLEMESLGIQGTNIYRIDDPVFQLFRPPWRWRCRCSWIPMTVKMAAAKGIQEAIDWLESGVEPSPPAWVQMPSFRPPAGFQRSVSGMPLSVQLSLEPFPVWLPAEKQVAQPTVPIIKEETQDEYYAREVARMRSALEVTP